MLSELINWGHVVENARYGREALVEHLLLTYEHVESSWDDGDTGRDVHLYQSPYGVVVLVWRYDAADDSPDPWSDAYRAELDARVDNGDFYASFREAAAEIREMGAAAGAAARLLPVLDGFSERPPTHHNHQW